MLPHLVLKGLICHVRGSKSSWNYDLKFFSGCSSTHDSNVLSVKVHIINGVESKHKRCAFPVTKVGEKTQTHKQAYLQSTALLEDSVNEMGIWAESVESWAMMAIWAESG